MKQDLEEFPEKVVTNDFSEMICIAKKIKLFRVKALNRKDRVVLYLLLSIVLSALLGWLLMMAGPLFGGIMAFGIVAGCLFRGVYLLNKLVVEFVGKD